MELLTGLLRKCFHTEEAPPCIIDIVSAECFVQAHLY